MTIIYGVMMAIGILCIHQAGFGWAMSEDFDKRRWVPHALFIAGLVLLAFGSNGFHS